MQRHAVLLAAPALNEVHQHARVGSARNHVVPNVPALPEAFVGT